MAQLDLDKDIAKGSFVAKIPNWLRWSIFIPAAIIASLVIPVLIYLFQSSDSLNNGWVRILQSVAFGAAFVLVGAYIAPKKQLVVAIILMVTIAMITALLVAYTVILSNESDWYLLMHGGAILIGGGLAISTVYEQQQT